MESLLNLNRESHKNHLDKLNEKLKDISAWITSVGGNNNDKALEFINEHFANLNDNTKKSLYEYILDHTGTRLLDVNKHHDLIKLIEDLSKLKQQIKQL